MRKDGTMKHLFKPETFKNLVALLLVLLIVKLLWFAVEVLWLPSVGVDHLKETGNKSLYYRVKLTPNAAPAPIQKTAPKKNVGSIKDITLLAIYNASDVTVITVRYKNKTKVLSKGDEINGFVLEGAGSTFATFSKAAKTYRVALTKGKDNSKSIRSVKSEDAPSSSAPSSVKPEGDVTDAGDHKIIDRSLLDHYAKNLKEVYKDIGITEIKEGKAIKGFKITFVKRDSPFAKLGVKRGDIIKSMNGQEINSYNAAFSMYKNIRNIENATLVIQRGKEEMELEYEIN
jgi:general secretion pathway protein C